MFTSRKTNLILVSPTFLLFGIRIPGGVRFLEQASRIVPELCVRTIVITGDATSPTTSAFLNSPEIIFLHKPFDLKDLQRYAELILNRTSTPQWRN